MASLQAPEFAYIAANVVRLRDKAGLTQAALAELADIDATYVAKIEAARVNLSVGVLVRIAAALGVEPARLLKKAKLIRRPPGRPRAT